MDEPKACPCGAEFDFWESGLRDRQGSLIAGANRGLDLYSPQCLGMRNVRSSSGVGPGR